MHHNTERYHYLKLETECYNKNRTFDTTFLAETYEVIG